MATFEFAGGLAADLFHDIDDPFCSAQGRGLQAEASPPSAEQPLEPRDFAPFFPSDATPTPTFSRPSGLITLPTPLFGSEEHATSRARVSWSGSILVLSLASIIGAASVTAWRERYGDVATASAVQTSAPRVAGETPAVTPSAAPARNPMTHAVQASAPQQLPTIVLSSRNHARLDGRKRSRASSPVARPDSKVSRVEAPRAKTQGQDRAGAARNEGRTHYAQRRYAEAADAYEEAARLDPSHALTFAGLGAARSQLGDVRGAIKAYERAVQLAPSNAVFQSSLIHAYVRDGNVRRARATCARAFELGPWKSVGQSRLHGYLTTLARRHGSLRWLA